MNALMMDTAFARLRRLCELNRATASRLAAAASRYRDKELKATALEVADQAHELANIVTLAGGWRLIAEADGLEIASKEDWLNEND